LDFGQHRGYTLMELLLVLAIIVIAAAAVAPRMTGVMRNVTLNSAAQTVRAELTRAHVMAMKTGRVQVFQYEPGGRKYKLEPWIAGDDAIESPNGQENSTPSSHAKTQVEPMLHEGAKFAAGDAAVESRSEKIEQELTDSHGTAWSRPIMFYPDGSAGDAYIVVGNDHNAGIRIDLRGMTAAVHLSEIKDLKLLEEDTTLSK
jgi:prepilin-type N-terminal cleavage/methylation domain-containing protein